MTGGLADIGLLSDGEHVLAVSSNGRGIFNLSSGERVARDSSNQSNDWDRGKEVDGFDFCAGEIVSMVGMFSGVEPKESVLSEIQQLQIHEQITGFRAALVSHDQSKTIVGYSDCLIIYSRNVNGACCGVSDLPEWKGDLENECYSEWAGFSMGAVRESDGSWTWSFREDKIEYEMRCTQDKHDYEKDMRYLPSGKWARLAAEEFAWTNLIIRCESD